MIEIPALAERWLDFWRLENHDRPLVQVSAPSGRSLPPIAAPESLAARWTDVDYMIAIHRRAMEETVYLGEAMPILSPNLGPDIVGAVCGCGLTFGEETSWANHFVRDWASLGPIRFSADNPWWRRIEAMTRAATLDARGDYLVGITDLHPGTDGLVSLRGPEALSLDLHDDPEAVLLRSDEVFEVYRQMYGRLDAIIAPHQRGTTNWMSIWHPDARWYVVGSDFSGMIGERDFERFVAPSLEREMAMLDATIYHLDGPGALRHLDRILAFDRLNGVQWVYGDGQPSALHWMDVYQKIQRAGKLVQVICRPEEAVAIAGALAPEGVVLSIGRMNDADDARDLISAIGKASRRRAPGRGFSVV